MIYGPSQQEVVCPYSYEVECKGLGSGWWIGVLTIQLLCGNPELTSHYNLTGNT